MNAMPRTNSSNKRWLHSASKLAYDGVQFGVKFVGSIEVKTPMKTLSFHARSQVAKECINRVCEEANLKSRKKRKIDKNILSYIADKPELANSGEDVTLTISSNLLRLVNSETNVLIGQYDMPKISFASGGDTDTLDFVAFVAKTSEDWRACYVLECVGGYASEIISTIGDAFELRYNQHLSSGADVPGGMNFQADKEYYNDLPGKIPPDLLAEVNPKPEGAVVKTTRTRKSSNLIDFNSPPTQHHDYINDQTDEFTDTAIDNVFGEGAVGGSFLDGTPTTAASNRINTSDPFQLSTEIQRSQLVTETWYHGCISRAEAEELLKRDGDFLVRESKGSKQFCLSGMQGTPRHLLLIDPHGQIRTKDMIFESISHLINFHFSNSLPIIVSDVGSALLLRYPIDKRLTTTTPRTPTTPTSPGVFFKTQ